MRGTLLASSQMGFLLWGGLCLGVLGAWGAITEIEGPLSGRTPYDDESEGGVQGSSSGSGSGTVNGLERDICESFGECVSCHQVDRCGWCASSGRCTANASSCERGWSSQELCYVTCGEAANPAHDLAGVVQLGAQSPYRIEYLPGEACLFIIWPLPESGVAGRRKPFIRLQFE